MSEQTVKDARAGVFWMHDAIFDEYASRIGVYGIAVYGLLCRRANAEHKCWPSLNRMAKDLSMSRSKMVTTLDELERAGLIHREQREEEGKGYTSTVYTLLQIGTLVRDKDKGSPQQRQALVHDTDPKEYKEEGIHKEGKEGTLEYLDAITRGCLKTLRLIPQFTRDEEQVAAKLSEYRQKWPTVDAVEVCEDYLAFCEAKQKRDPSLLQLRNFFKQQAKRTPTHPEPHRRKKRVI